MINTTEQIETQENKVEKTIVIPKREENSLLDFHLKTPEEIVELFSRLPNAKIVGNPKQEESFLYIPGTRDDKVLLVAHFDTVWSNKNAPCNIAYCVEDDLYFSQTKGVGIGADDRAGIAILWELKELGHSLLLPNAEELGCRGSRFLMKDEKWREIIRSHNFAIEMDRRGKDDLVFYNVAAKGFKDWCKKEFIGYTEAQGSWTDICVLCDEDIHKENCPDGLNISVGYYNQHSDSEHLILKEWTNTLDILKKVLGQKDIPRFHHKYQEKKYSTHNYTEYTTHYPTNNNYTPKRNVFNSDLSEFILCCINKDCNGVMDKTEYKQNGKKCIYCQMAF